MAEGNLLQSSHGRSSQHHNSHPQPLKLNLHYLLSLSVFSYMKIVAGDAIPVNLKATTTTVEGNRDRLGKNEKGASIICVSFHVDALVSQALINREIE